MRLPPDLTLALNSDQVDPVTGGGPWTIEGTGLFYLMHVVYTMHEAYVWVTLLLACEAASWP